MAKAFRVLSPFSRKDPVSGEMVEYQKGDLIAHPERIADIRSGEHDAHGHMVELADDHPAVKEAAPAEDKPTSKKPAAPADSAA